MLSPGAVNQPLSTHAQPKDRAGKIVLFGMAKIAPLDVLMDVVLIALLDVLFGVA